MSQFSLSEPLELKIPERAFEERWEKDISSVAPQPGQPETNEKQESELRARPARTVFAVAGIATATLGIPYLWSVFAPLGSASGSAAPTAVEAARLLQGRWRSEHDPSCGAPFTLAVSGGKLSFTGPDTPPIAEDIVGFAVDGAVRTDLKGAPATYKQEGSAMLFTYNEGRPTRYQRCEE